MAKEKFIDRTFEGTINVACKYEDGTVRYWNEDKRETIDRIIKIVELFSRKGYTLTLRQLHYQLVTRNWIVNHNSAYQKLSGLLDDCRYGGLIDWNAIEDRGRVPYLPYWVNDVEHALQDSLDQYRVDRQKDQPNHVELWTEKDALSGILRRSTEKYHIQLVVNKGYTSSSAIYRAYQRILNRIWEGQKVTILYFGDHDPSGLDMVRDIRERLLFFLSRGDGLRKRRTANRDSILDVAIEWGKENLPSLAKLVEFYDMPLRVYNKLGKEGSELTPTERKEFSSAVLRAYIDHEKLLDIKAIGLTMEQINTYDLPPNPTKMTDSRAEGYIQKFGKICWEVDALDPEQLTDIVETNIEEILDMDLFDENLQREEDDKGRLQEIIDGLE
jgi:hypothetical protein